MTYAKLYKVNPNENAVMLTEKLELAQSFFSRGRGLLGRKSIANDAALWIKPGNNLHTFFMAFAIDSIFIDKNLKVKKIHSRIKPFRLVGPVWSAQSFIEVKSGQAEIWKLAEGDQLYVVS